MIANIPIVTDKKSADNEYSKCRRKCLRVSKIVNRKRCMWNFKNDQFCHT